MFETTGFYNTGSRHYMFITIHDAVVSAQLNQWSISVVSLILIVVHSQLFPLTDTGELPLIFG